MLFTKEEFKSEYAKMMAEKYGRDVSNSHVTERFLMLGDLITKYVSLNWKETKERVEKRGEKQLYYFSMEFLPGRLLLNNLYNLGIYSIVEEGLKELGIELNELIEIERDPGLGNGGLGRLASCFMDSLATLSYAGHGNSIRYEYGLFKQVIEDGHQVELPDLWLAYGNVWEVRKIKYAVDVPFWGRVNITTNEDGSISYKHVDAEFVRAVPCDIPMVGYNTTMTNTLRLWAAEPTDTLPKGKDLRTYLSEIRAITQNVYPDDTTEQGKYLRLKQQYFFVSAGLQAIIMNHLEQYQTLDNFSDKVVIQLNDTHPVMCIPELMRLLMDEHGYDWDSAWAIVTKVFAYTNHTIMVEALEKWPVEYFKRLLPRIFLIIDEINRRHMADVYRLTSSQQLAYNTSCIKDGLVHMAYLAIIGCFSVNGVAKIHSNIIKSTIFKDFYEIYPSRFNNKTNGVTMRRWLLYSNPELTEMLIDTIGDEFIEDSFKLEKLMDYVDDPRLQDRFLEIKAKRKRILADLILKETGIALDTNSIFDTQAKRLHAYKRQLLKALHIIYLIQQIREDENFEMIPMSFIFAAKAAPSYAFAKQVIKLINTLSDIVEKDERLRRFIRVVFIPNYRVSIAEKLMNGSDVSEQISTAGKEASGTGNMKFMMNGALTLGTMDGANIEIHDLVGRENDIIFGLRVEDLFKLQFNGYSAKAELDKNPALSRIVHALIDGSLSVDRDEFKLIYDELIYKNDEYYVLADFGAYVEAQKEVQKRYADQRGWAKSCLINIAKSGYFSSDRTIRDYAEQIWKIKRLDR